MFATLSSIDAAIWLSILVKAVAYATTVLAIGSVLILCLLRGLSADGQKMLRRIAVASAIAAAFFTALRLPLQASFLMGGTFEGALDPMILSLVVEGPLGSSVAVRLAGLALILPVIWRPHFAILGALLAAISFALRGHVLGGPHLILGAFLCLHILALSFWVGAFAPLARSARVDPPAQAGALAQEFGVLALWAVAGLGVAGMGLLVLLGATTPDLLSTDYGQFIAVKLALFTGLLGLAALNKLDLTPALLDAKPGAGQSLRRSIGLETALVAGILLTTATLTTVSSPAEQDGDAISHMSRPIAPAHLPAAVVI